MTQQLPATATWAALTALLLAAACQEPGVTQRDTDTDADTDTDTDADTDTVVEAREGCLPGELDEGWALEPSDGDFFLEVAPNERGGILATTYDDGLWKVSLDELASGHLPTDERLLFGAHGGLVGTSLTLDAGSPRQGFAYLGSRGNQDDVRLWTAWPGPWHDTDDADARVITNVDIEERGQPSIGDFDGDGLDDLHVAVDEERLVVLLSPLTDSMDVSDGELNIGHRDSRYSERMDYPDWNQDGYDDLLIDGQGWIGPLYGRDPDEPPDLTIRAFGPEEQRVSSGRADPNVPLHDLDGDGVAEIWLGTRPHQPRSKRWVSTNFPGTGVHDIDDLGSAALLTPDGIDLYRPPLTADYDGDGVEDTLVGFPEDVYGHAHVTVLPGPFAREQRIERDGLHVFTDGVGAHDFIRWLSDLNGDGRSDFVVNNIAYAEGEPYRPHVWLGCPDW